MLIGDPLSAARRAEHCMGMPAAERRRWTATEVRRLAADSPEYGPRYELIAGELLVTPAPTPRHQLALAWFYDRLSPYVQQQQIGRALWSPADLELAPGELTQPDLFVIPTGRPPANWSDITRLLLAVEVLSPGTARFDRTVKRPFYQRVGVPNYWIADLDAQLVERWRPSDDRPEIVVGALEWQPDAASAPLLLPFEELWMVLPTD
jgi:Uma2 family endonuclease